MKKITLRDFFATLFGGIWQAILWILGFFGYKDDSSFGKVIKRIFASCVTIIVVLITCCAVYSFIYEVVYKDWVRPYTSDCVWETRYISNYIALKNMLYSHYNKICDMNTGEVILDRVDWIVTSPDKDSLAVFARNGKRGYINRFTGEIAVPETYSRAWVFSEGLAAVEKDGELLFIDHSGKVVIDKDFQVYFDNPKYAFQKGYCIIKNPVNGKMGLIDKKGNWALEAVYDNLFNNEGFWQVEKDGRVGLYTSNMKLMYPVENTAIYVNDNCIEVRHADHIARRYDFEGNVVVDFVIDEVSNMQYETTELRNDLETSADMDLDNMIYGVASCQRYLVRSGNYYDSDYYGLLDRNGKIITLPVYTSIEAIGKDLYLCQPDGVIVNGRGEIISQ